MKLQTGSQKYFRIKLSFRRKHYPRSVSAEGLDPWNRYDWFHRCLKNPYRCFHRAPKFRADGRFPNGERCWYDGYVWNLATDISFRLLCWTKARFFFVPTKTFGRYSNERITENFSDIFESIPPIKSKINSTAVPKGWRAFRIPWRHSLSSGGSDRVVWDQNC
jgi:hypothetical protein